VSFPGERHDRIRHPLCSRALARWSSPRLMPPTQTPRGGKSKTSVASHAGPIARMEMSQSLSGALFRRGNQVRLTHVTGKA